MLNGLSSLSETLTDSTLQMVRNIPHLALIPLVILWFGIDEEAKIFLVALGVFFPIYVNTQHGVRSVDPHLLEMGRAYGMTKATLFLRVVLPGALPSIFVGLRYGLGIMWLTLIVAETISASSGIGYMAMNAREFMMVDVVVLSILVYAALGKLADSIGAAAGAYLPRLEPRLRKDLSHERWMFSTACNMPDPRVSVTGADVKLQGVNKSFGDHRVLRGIDLAIEPGQFVAIVGRSGCGKSTLLRLIAGLDTPTAGSIAVDQQTTGWRDVVRLMFQEPRLLPWQRVVANVAVGLTHAPDRQTRRDQAAAALARGRSRRTRERLAVGAVGRPEAARCPGARAGQSSAIAAAR